MKRSTEQVLNAIVSIIAKNGVSRKGNSWARITTRYLAQQINCSEQTIRNQTKIILDLGLFKKEQFGLKKLDKANSWAINFDNPNLFNQLDEYRKQKTFLSASTHKKILNIYKDINHNNKSQENFKNKKSPPKKPDVEKKTSKIAGSSGFSSKLNNYNYVTPSVPGNTTVQDMIKIWNQTFNRNDFLSKNRAKFLYASFLQKFKSLDSWKKYLERIKKMDLSRIRDLFSWALSFKTINGLLNFMNSKKPEKLCVGAVEAKEIARSHIEQSSTEPNECIQLRKTLLDKLGAYTYNSWFSRVMFKKTNEKIEVIGDSFVVDYIQNHFLREYV